MSGACKRKNDAKLWFKNKKKKEKQTKKVMVKGK